MGVFGAVNVGEDASWWDYGMLRLYRKNNLLLTAVSHRKVYRLISQNLERWWPYVC